MTKERVGRIIAMIGKEAGIVVRHKDERTGTRVLMTFDEAAHNG